MNDQEDFFYNRDMFFEELSQSIGLQNFKKILLILVPEEPTIPSNVCEELIIWALSVYRINVSYETKSQYFFFWLLYVVEEKLTNMDVIDKYFKLFFFLCDYGNLNQPVSGILYYLIKPDDVEKWMVSKCKMYNLCYKSQPFMDKLLNFLESSNILQETRCKGLFDSNTKFCKELAYGLRSVRKEIVHLRPSINSQQLMEFRHKNLGKTSINRIQIFNERTKFELPCAENLSKAFMKQSISNNSLLNLNNISGWCKLLLNTDKDLNLQNRFSNNLAHTLDQIFLKNELILPQSKKLKLLQDVLMFQKFAHRGLVAVNKFIFEYLLSWDGIQYARIIYELFEYLTFTSEEELRTKFLEKLHAIFISGDELIYRMVINSLTNLLCNLHLNSRQTINTSVVVLFGNKLREETEYEIVKCLTDYVSHWCSVCVYHYPHDELLKNTIYNFFEKVNILENLQPNMWSMWTLMPPNVFYNGLMSINIYWLNRLSKLMLRHINYDVLRISEVDNAVIINTLQRFEEYMGDFYNALYVGELFEKREEGFLFNKLKKQDILTELKMVNLNTCFQVEKHIALAPYFMKDENSKKDPMEILQIEASNIHTLLVTLDERLQNSNE
ncbi:centromere protein I-like isoform X2 [Daktulosphaira vitifoliae]|uniref:centromere protein I-like isoform X2 n=1 Tax=Daktulosphaira vitifoliae TaxID=58002 RepID=UPI0021AB0502|nr:centromere protein I-like isoform X2 [Daktulosphaira vitifoliae]